MENIRARPHFPNIAFRLNITEEIDNLPELARMMIFFKNFNDTEVEVEIVDKELVTYRHLYDDTVEGSSIKMNELKGGTHRTYSLKFDVEKNDENDRPINCTNYPNENFKNFSACDSTFVEETLDLMGLQNFVPIWSTENFLNVSTKFESNCLTKPSPNGGIVKETYQMLDLMDGRSKSDCKSPCLKTKALVRLDSTEHKGFIQEDMLILAMVQEVTKTVTTVNSIELASVLSIIGSGFGLWLGLNLPKILHNVYEFVSSRDCFRQ